MATERNGIAHLKITRPLSEVPTRPLSILRAKAVPVFAVVDQSGEAAKIGLHTRDTKLVIFGNPKAGTPLMIASPDSALDLPLKILLAEDEHGGTRVSYNSTEYVRERNGLTPELAESIAAIEQIAAAIVSA